MDEQTLDQDSSPSTPRIILTLRCLSLRLLLYRVILAKYLDSSVEDSFLNRVPSFDAIGRLYSGRCADVAHQMIDLIASYHSGGKLPSWWFVLYYRERPRKQVLSNVDTDMLLVIQAPLVIFATAVVVDGDERADAAQADVIASILKKAAFTIEHVASNTRLARRCSKYLKAIITAHASISRSTNCSSVLSLRFNHLVSSIAIKPTSN